MKVRLLSLIGISNQQLTVSLPIYFREYDMMIDLLKEILEVLQTIGFFIVLWFCLWCVKWVLENN